MKHLDGFQELLVLEMIDGCNGVEREGGVSIE